MIIGKQNPVVGAQESYEINDFSTNIIFNSDNSQYIWYLWRKRKNGTWLDITKKEPKNGTRITYKFGETFLGIQFKIQVYKATKNMLIQKFDAKLFGELIIVPTSSKTPNIERVVLFNGGSKEVNKAHYTDTLTARAYCTAMFGQTVEFNLWEDDAAGPGHNSTINKNNKFSIPFPAKVNEKGIAEVQIKLASNESILKSIANKYVMKDDSSEGKNHEYYVTASYYGKIQGSSQVNVNVANPDYKKNSPKSQPQAPAQKPTTVPVIPKTPAQSSKPKENTPKFPATKTSTALKQADTQGRIIDAYFVNAQSQRLTKVAVGDHVQVQIMTNNMIGKHVQYRIWEDDSGSNDFIYESARLEVKGNAIIDGGFTISHELFKKGIDLGKFDPDAKSQSYFIEILPLDVSAESKKFGLTDEKERLEVTKSLAKVGKLPKQEEKQDDGKCPRCEKEITTEQLQKIYPNCKDSTILKELTQSLNKYRKVFKLDTCARKAHFFAQSIQEAGESLTPGLEGESFNYYKDNLAGNLRAFRTEDGKKIAQKHGRQHKPRNPAVLEADQIILANFAYGSQYKTGKIFKNTGNDGWNFRGRGLLQITGRSNYVDIQGVINQLAPDSNIDILKRFDSSFKPISVANGHMTPLEASLTGLADWYKDNMYTAADSTGKKEDNEVVDMIVDIINSLTDSREKRKEYYQKTKIIFEVDKCPKVKPQKNDNETGKCTEDCSQCFNYADVVDNPKINNQSDNVNKNRWHRAKRYNKTHPDGYYHTGTDILASTGTAVKSMLCGVVMDNIVMSFSSNQYFENSLGNYVVIKSKDKDGNDVYIKYCHLDKVTVSVGQKIKHGEKIGESGSTGNAASVFDKKGNLIHGIYPKYRHIHIEAATSSGFGKTRVDAENYMKTKFDETKKGNPK